ncbi:MAG TPA: guanylate kinase [Campylobacterales bacterium]|nr:guanylate kinase [Campylobacterales bacterium]
MNGSLLVISGPSGCGKSSLLNEILQHDNSIYFSISTTTRSIRDGEKEGVDYYYVSKQEFEKDIKENNFLEWANVHDNYYGTSLKPIKKALADGKLVIFDIDVQGHEIVKKKFPNLLTSLFITTPSQIELEKRLTKRGTDSHDTIQKRVSNAKDEMKRVFEYEYFLVNDNFEKTLEDLKSIIKVTRVKKSKEDLSNFLSNW